MGGAQYVTRGKESDIHQDISVEYPEKDKATATIDLWNLSRARWNSIEKGQPIVVLLGYVDGPKETQLIGTVSKVGSPEAQGADTKYTVEAQDESEGRIRATRFSKTWNQPTIGTIVRDIFGEASVGAARVDAPAKPFERRYPIDKTKPANKWLDRMATEAEERDPQGRKYKWKAERGQGFFWPQEEAREDSAVVLKRAKKNQPGNIESLDVADGKTEKTDGPADLDFQAYLDPRLRKDGLVSVQGTDNDGVYRVTKCTLESSVTDGVHKMSGTLSDPSAKFRVEKPTVASTGERISVGGGGSGGV